MPLPAGGGPTVAKNTRPGGSCGAPHPRRRFGRGPPRRCCPPSSARGRVCEARAPRARRRLPRNVRAFPTRVAPYFGTGLGPAEHAQAGRGTAGLSPHPLIREQFLLVHGTAGNGVARPHRASRRDLSRGGARRAARAHAHLRPLRAAPADWLASRQRGLPVVAVGGIMADGSTSWSAPTCGRPRGSMQRVEIRWPTGRCACFWSTRRRDDMRHRRSCRGGSPWRQGHSGSPSSLEALCCRSSRSIRAHVLGSAWRSATDRSPDRSSASPLPKPRRVRSVLRGDRPEASGAALRLRTVFGSRGCPQTAASDASIRRRTQPRSRNARP